ncbi:Uroporphyrinogen decarboxylase [Neomoorella glycerini]|uniref:Uroporphyrinogen decarboxylase n=1 Tax=Neomoorella glycerini TaxID=55779 RepID=A0A6I5ZPA6_9FIRM|nr:uroporphyrinogen decarboxylase family protein [Moorella glycerini]QGP91606.1 Uroporphyrinogen decarboxylase [Moorella glycerini]
MKPKERVIKTLQREEPDRIPTFEWIISPSVIEKMTGQRDEVKFIELMDIDGMAVAPNMKKEVIDSRHYRDEWGIVRASYDEYPMPVDYPIKDEEDLKKLRVPDPDADYRFDDIKRVMEAIGDTRAVIIRLRDVFSQPRDLMGFEGFLMGFYTQPDVVERLMEISVDYSTRLARNIKELGGEIIVVGDDIADNKDLLISPEMYRKMVLPHFKRLIQNFKALGFYVIKHTDGNIMKVIEDLIDTGIDCLDPIDPLGGMDLEYMKKTYGDRICLKGNVDCVSTLVDKKPEDVIEEVKDCIRKAGAGGGYIISSSNSIHAGINPVNYKTFLDAIKEYGTYPLDWERLGDKP